MARYYEDSELVLPDRARDLLLERKQTVAVAESVTAGYLQMAISQAENAMNFFQGGITAYNLGQKTRHLHVDPIHALSCNCISEQVAARMAQQVCNLFLSDWGVAITGYASPVPEKKIEQLFACYAIYFRGREMVRETILVETNPPAKVKLFYAYHLLNHFSEIISSHKDGKETGN